jgi:glycosyltransferase involved in cell wall biosynthesis
VQASEDLLANAAVSVLLTDARRHREGISNSLVESMALGVPVVATAGGGTDEVVEDGVSGLLVPSGDAAAAAGALARLLDDAALRERLAAGARRKVTEAFGLERFLREHQDLYESVLAAAPDGAPASPASPPSPR